MSYRPITDVWILARAKLKNGRKYYGAYLGGFPERARRLLGVTIKDPVLHVCGGAAKDYPYRNGFGVNDKTMDLDPEVNPDILHDVRKAFPLPLKYTDPCGHVSPYDQVLTWKPKAYLCDPPYSPEDAKNYIVGRDVYPSPSLILKNCFNVMNSGERAGIIHYLVPKPPKNSIFIACIGIICGFSNRIRAYSVFEKI